MLSMSWPDMTQITDYDVTGFLVCVMRPYAPVALCTRVIQIRWHNRLRHNWFYRVCVTRCLFDSPKETTRRSKQWTLDVVFFHSEHQMDSALHTCSLIKTLGQNVVTNCKTLDQNVVMSIGWGNVIHDKTSYVVIFYLCDQYVMHNRI